MKFKWMDQQQQEHVPAFELRSTRKRETEDRNRLGDTITRFSELLLTARLQGIIGRRQSCPDKEEWREDGGCFSGLSSGWMTRTENEL